MVGAGSDIHINLQIEVGNRSFHLQKVSERWSKMCFFLSLFSATTLPYCNGVCCIMYQTFRLILCESQGLRLILCDSKVLD